ncbi:unnamed protein product [Ilex paraguariensis]|uniref:F-box domain-containing protein n=1 Tax=Ilex paraguariensis TaxID=185542 RepID=A0ABC8RM01_9AQUA
MKNGVGLPQEIVTDILSRLPANSIGQFRCISMLWRSQLSSPELIKAHLNRNTHYEKLILISCNHSLFSLTLNNNPLESDSVATKLNFQESNNWGEVVGSCNDLLLVINGEDKKFLLKPTTRESKKLPDSSFALDPFASFIMYGLGFDSSIDDYKVVTLSSNDTDNEHEPDCTNMFENVYSLKSNSWKRVQNSPYDHAVALISSEIYVNGCVHWLASRVSDYLLVTAAFDLGDEKFREVAAPSSLDKDKFVYNKLLVLGGCLCMLDRNQTDLWVMKEYGVEESWTKYMICVPDACEITPLCLWGDEVVLLDLDGERLNVYNLKEETSRNLVVLGAPNKFEYGESFVESLVSPDRGNEIRGVE